MVDVNDFHDYAPDALLDVPGSPLDDSRSIILAPWEAEAIIAGAKTRITRLVNPLIDLPVESGVVTDRRVQFSDGKRTMNRRCPYFTESRILWAKESYRSVSGQIRYATSNDLRLRVHNSPALYMLRPQSRLSLAVAGIYCVRLTSLTDDDAVADGVNYIYRDAVPDKEKVASALTAQVLGWSKSKIRRFVSSSTADATGFADTLRFTPDTVTPRVMFAVWWETMHEKLPFDLSPYVFDIRIASFLHYGF